MKRLKNFLLVIFLVFFQSYYSQSLPSNTIIETENLIYYLKPEIKKYIEGFNENSKAKLAAYFRDKFSERYFYDWKNFEKRFENYKSIFPEAENAHNLRALDHLSKFIENTTWKLPFNYQNGEPLNAYAFRHLARQHKMVDIAFLYHYQNKNVDYLNYFENQLRSLNTALITGNYESIENGNGVYESFRSGYRILNWLNIHNMFLIEKAYSDEDQLVTIATLLQHGENLFETNAEFVRPKWGVYRSLINSQDLRDETVLFANFSIEEVESLALESSELEKFSVFPNPTKTTVQLKGLPQETNRVAIYAMDGRIVLESTTTSKSEQTLNVSSLSNGTYIIKVSGDQSHQSKLIVISK